jgi:transcriptional regulator with XRE-family HTH domain
MTNLKTIRQANNLSQSQLAEKANVNLRMVQNYEQGFKDINKAQAITLYKIAQVLDCMIEDLLELEVKYDND